MQDLNLQPYGLQCMQMLNRLTLIEACCTMALILCLLKKQMPLSSQKLGNYFFRTGNHLTNAAVRIFPSKVLMSFQYGSGAINTLKGQLRGKKLAYLGTDLWYRFRWANSCLQLLSINRQRNCTRF